MYKKIAFVCFIAMGCGSSQSAHHEEHSGGECGEHERGEHERGECDERGERRHHGERGERRHHGERGERGHHGEHHGERGHRGPPEVLVPYHDVLAPVWHSEAGEVRAGLACEAVADLIAQGEALAAAPAPNDAENWAAEVQTLGENGQALATLCADDAATVEAKEASMDTLHDTFHRLMGLAR